MIQETARLCKVLRRDDCMEMPMTPALEQIKQPSRLNGHYTNGVEVLSVDRFPYGWRTIAQVQPDGSTTYIDIPLTQADFFDPRVGDHLVQSDAHLKLMLSLVGRFEQHYLHDPAVFEKRNGEIELTGYRFVNGRRRKIQPDARGRLLSETTQVWFELDEKKRKLHLVYAITGQRLLTHAKERQRAEAAEAEVVRLRSLLASQQ